MCVFELENKSELKKEKCVSYCSMIETNGTLRLILCG